MCVPAVIILRVGISVGLCGRVCLHINMDIFSIYINFMCGLVCIFNVCDGMDSVSRAWLGTHNRNEPYTK